MRLLVHQMRAELDLLLESSEEYWGEIVIDLFDLTSELESELEKYERYSS